MPKGKNPGRRPAKKAAPKKKGKLLRRTLLAAAVGGTIAAGVHIYNPKLIPREFDRLATKYIFKPMVKRDWRIRNKRITKNFEANRAAVDSFIRSKAKEIAKYKDLKHEIGGVIYKRNGKMVMEWLRDPTDSRFTNLQNQLNCGNVKRMSLKEFDWGFHKVKQMIKGTESKNIVSAFEKAREIIAKGQTGKKSHLLTQTEKALFEGVAGVLEIQKKYSYGHVAMNKAFELDKDPKNQVFAAFHTHPQPGSKPIGSDLEKTAKALPSAVFSFKKNGVNVYYITNKKAQHRLTIPYQ